MLFLVLEIFVFKVLGGFRMVTVIRHAVTQIAIPLQRAILHTISDSSVIQMSYATNLVLFETF